ncbi:34567_t:CDS:2, partial [Racocetra persica]
LNYNVMDVCHVEVGRKKHEGLKHNDEVIGCVPGFEIDVDSIKVVQEFYVKHELASDIIL